MISPLWRKTLGSGKAAQILIHSPNIYAAPTKYQARRKKSYQKDDNYEINPIPFSSLILRIPIQLVGLKPTNFEFPKQESKIPVNTAWCPGAWQTS